MGDFGDYLAAVGPLWWGIVSAGGLFGFDEFAQRVLPHTKRWLDRQIAPERRRKIEYGLIVVAVFFAGFYAWQGEHREKLKADTQLAAVGQRQDRHLKDDESRKLEAAVRPIVLQLPKVWVRAGYALEEQQYASEFMKLFDAVGVQLVNRKQGAEFFAEPTTANSTAIRGLLIGVADKFHPPETAIVFKRALDAAGFRSDYAT